MPLPLAATLIPAGVSLAGALFANNKKPKQSPLQGQYQSAMRDAGAAGYSAETDYMKRLQGFDAMDSFNTAAKGFYNTMRTEMDRDLRTLRGNMAGTGRLQSGVGERDENRLFENHYDRLNNVLMQNAMNATKMQMDNTSQIGAYGVNKMNTYYDMVSGGLDRETAEENRKRQKNASLLGGLGSLAGYAIGHKYGGGQLGGMTGSYIGGQIGSAFGG